MNGKYRDFVVDHIDATEYSGAIFFVLILVAIDASWGDLSMSVVLLASLLAMFFKGNTVRFKLRQENLAKRGTIRGPEELPFDEG